MNDTLRERIAEAIWEQMANNVRRLVEPWPEVQGPKRRQVLALSDAVLSVLHEAGEQGDGTWAAEVALDNVLDRIGQDISRESAIHAVDELRRDGWMLVRSLDVFGLVWSVLHEAGTQEDET